MKCLKKIYEEKNILPEQTQQYGTLVRGTDTNWVIMEAEQNESASLSLLQSLVKVCFQACVDKNCSMDRAG